MSRGISIGADGRPRCAWGDSTEDYRPYHDTEWGFPVDDDVRLFEKLSLEGFQAGLSWLTILRKREAFRAGFAGFDPERVARFTERDVARLLADAGIIRHRGKIEAVINNAARALELIAREGSIARYVWSFEPAPTISAPVGLDEVPAVSPESAALSKDLKQRGWKFVGPTTMYAFMQSMGIVDDHLRDCHVRAHVETARSEFDRP